MPGHPGHQAAFWGKERVRLSDWRKLQAFADAPKEDPEFSVELPHFLSAIYRVLNQYKIAGYGATQKPRARRALRRLLTDRV